MISFAATLIALKFAESTRGIQFEGWDDVLWTGVICWVGDWIVGALMFALSGPDFLVSSEYRVAFSLGLQVVSVMPLLLLAWAVVSGTRIRNIFGLVVASVLIVLFNYAAAMLVAASGMGLWLG